MPATVVLDAGLGDSGKGKIAAFLALSRGVRHVVDGGTGPSAGHVLPLPDGPAHTVSQVPVGFAVPDARLYIGPGTLVSERVLRAELAGLAAHDAASRLLVDRRCGLIPDDAHAREREQGLHDLGLSWEAGTTAARVDYLWRRARLYGELVDPPCPSGDVVAALNAVAVDEDVLVLGAHGADYSLYTGSHYPITTSDNCSAAATLSRTGLAWRYLREVVAVVNMTPTVTSPVPLAHELTLTEIRRRGLESHGAVSGVRRRVAARPDLDMLRRFVRTERPSSLALGRADLYDPDCAGARDTAGLTAGIRSWIDQAEDDLGVPVSLVSTGPAVGDIVRLGEPVLAPEPPASHRRPEGRP
ncbi:adenylosuccinate synthetase [Actinomadura macrotermitis]|uniref:Adenylosuccinate synthetase n=1 Tax=Actinomadura macrotermitis TaxID=2585200 RepID=A0A7K0BV09_9ACTN|nr:adenylosuccinate synthetase [Actinomadura macrotermitis]MQY05028.1 Adenylosuccinate synthetase [Actinomadura macrotermitis]